MKVLFCNVGWMEFYKGLNGADPITSGGEFVREQNFGYEVCNFVAFKGWLYGYVQPPKTKINIEKFGALKDAVSVNGVTIVWTATRPHVGSVIIGWYKNAEVYREFQKFKDSSEIHRQNKIDGYWVKCQSHEAKLLPLDQRVLRIPRGKPGYMGRSNIWYADSPECESFVKHVIDLVNKNSVKMDHVERIRNNSNQELKAEIEKAAISKCCKYYEDCGYEVTSVEKDNLGWDLEAKSEYERLRIEVKGLSENNFAIELTPNEYKAFKEKSSTYRLAVVTNTLVDPIMYLCRYSKAVEKWIIDDHPDKNITIDIKESALVKAISGL